MEPCRLFVSTHAQLGRNPQEMAFPRPEFGITLQLKNIPISLLSLNPGGDRMRLLVDTLDKGGLEE
jgi:hypothetical protein